MHFSSRPQAVGHMALGSLAILAVALAFGLMGMRTAWAHEGEEPVPARQAVLQAIAYIVNTPDNSDAINDKLSDAQESEDTSGVDLDLVSKAQAAVASNHMAEARDLLQQSIGAQADVTGTDVQPILHVAAGTRHVVLATGEQPGTQIVTDELAGRTQLSRTDAVLIGMSIAVGAIGVFLAVRFRPRPSRQQRPDDAPRQGGRP